MMGREWAGKVSVNKEQYVASMYTAALYMAHDRDRFGSFAAGVLNGIKVLMEVLEVPVSEYGYDVLEGDEPEIERKCLAAGAAIVDMYDDMSLRMSAMEAQSPGAHQMKQEFIDKAKARFSNFLKDTHKEN